MHLNMVSKVLGMLLMVFSLTLLAPVVVGYIYNEDTQHAFLMSFSITFASGLLMWLPFSRLSVDLRTRDGFLITVLFWVELGVVGALPFLLVDEVNLSVTNAIFESISGLTTTGATVISGLDHLPKSILYYRQQLQWLGGIGIVVIAVAIMPMLGVGGMQLYRAETPGPVKDSKMTPRITETAKALFIIYVLLTAACALAYWLAGMTAFDAIGHSFATVAIGGFSTHDASMGFFDSDAILAICIFFMVISGISFSLHYYTWLRFSITHYWRNPESKMYLMMLLTGCVMVSGYLFFQETHDWHGSIVHGVFELVSFMTTTGFTTDNYSVWPTFIPYLLLVLSFFGACAGSTGGGLKVGRMLIMTKQVLREVHRLIHPNAVHPIKIRNRVVESRVADAVWAFFGIYLAVYYAITLLLLASGLDFTTAWSATAAALNNLGPGLGQVSAHYHDINSFAKWLLVIGMLLGRLEIFTLLVLFSPLFWRQ